MRSKFVQAIGIASMIFMLFGCSSVSEYGETVLSYVPGMDYFMAENLTTIKIRSTKCTNNGTPFYMLIKSSDYPTFLTDDYFKIAHLVAHPPEELACFATICIVPGIDQIIEIETPESKSLAVYFLFTRPGDVWKQILEIEGDCSTIKIQLDNNQIQLIEL